MKIDRIEIDYDYNGTSVNIYIDECLMMLIFYFMNCMQELKKQKSVGFCCKTTNLYKL